ncbi:Hypothetical protein CINCED_3A007416 [Cinara cedri]|uniref:Uncharacterized protein n=1 Tax=Cinara cedri TaxID=506608 RepID=A0A5E4MAH0_9HEMI|nr:Hypothetical protein CINCED_3A007416 [Cinara cedri]
MHGTDDGRTGVYLAYQDMKRQANDTKVLKLPQINNPIENYSGRTPSRTFQVCYAVGGFSFAIAAENRGRFSCVRFPVSSQCLRPTFLIGVLSRGEVQIFDVTFNLIEV